MKSEDVAKRPFFMSPMKEKNDLLTICIYDPPYVALMMIFMK
jgi:hypothetical protein